MKALTIWQPWATLIARGIKRVETRPWSTNYRGEIAIHAAARKPAIEIPGVPNIIRKHELENYMPLGKVICIVMIVACLPVDAPWFENLSFRNVFKKELPLGDFSSGRFGFVLDHIKLIKPVKVRGQQRFWNWNPRKGELEEIAGPIKKGTPLNLF